MTKVAAARPAAPSTRRADSGDAGWPEWRRRPPRHDARGKLRSVLRCGGEVGLATVDRPLALPRLCGKSGLHMRVLVAHNHYQQPGGEDQSFAAEVAALRGAGHDVTDYAVHNDSIGGMGRLAVAAK